MNGRKVMSILLLFSLLTVSIAFLTSDNTDTDGLPPSDPITDPKPTPKEDVSIYDRVYIEINEILLPSNGYKGATSWWSSDARVAYVNSDGKLTAKGIGMVKISCKVNGQERFVYIYVILKTVEIFGPDVYSIGDVGNFSASSDVTWRSSNTSVMTIDDDGRALAISPGVANILALESGYHRGSSILVYVLETPFTAVSGNIRDLNGDIIFTHKANPFHNSLFTETGELRNQIESYSGKVVNIGIILETDGDISFSPSVAFEGEVVIKSPYTAISISPSLYEDMAENLNSIVSSPHEERSPDSFYIMGFFGKECRPIDITLKDRNGAQIHDLPHPLDICMKIPEGKNVNDLKVAHISDEDGSLVETFSFGDGTLRLGEGDLENYVCFSTMTLSTFVLYAEEEHENDHTLLIYIAILALIIIIATAVFLSFRKVKAIKN